MTNPITVLIIPEQFPSDLDPVAGVFMQDQIKALSPLCDVIVWNTNPWYRGVYVENQAARYFDFHLFNSKWPKPFNLLAYRWWIRQSLRLAKCLPKPDIVHLHGAAIRGGMARQLAEFWQVPLVVTEHTGPWSMISDRKSVYKRAKETLGKAEAVLPVSHHLQAEIWQSGIHSKRVEIFGNPVDTHFFDLRPSALTAEKRILFVGRLDPFKGGLRTAKAFAQAINSLEGFSLEIIGEGSESTAISAFIETNNLSDRIEFRNTKLSREAMRAAFHRSSFLVFPSLFESFGLVAAEAMATGLPVVITDRTGPRDYFTPNAGIAVHPESTEAIADAMKAMVAEIGRYEPAKIRSHIVDHFGVAHYGDRLHGLYASLISAKFAD